MKFTVYGAPATKGAVRPVPIKKNGVIVGSRITEDSKKSRPWAALIQDAAQQQIGNERILFPSEAVSVALVFWMPRPKSLPKTRPSAPDGQRCDIDKLERAVLDALTGVLWTDDGQVVKCRKWKAYDSPAAMPRVVIEVEPVDLNEWPWNQSIVTQPKKESAACSTLPL